MDMKWIKDPIYGYVQIPDNILPILDSWMVQRLRRIKQLIFVNLVYPSANHTRFEHSLGVMHLAGILSEHLGLEKEFYQICGLLHDIGHGPFSHLSELISLIFTGKSHEERAKEILKENSDLLENFDWREIYREISGRGIGVISGDFDVDRLDYLSRDAYHTGNPMGISDVFTLMRNMKLFDEKIVLTEKGVGPAESVLLARNFMRRYVYYHKTKLSADSMVLKQIIKYVEEGFLNVEEFMRMDDYTADEILRNGEYYRRVVERRLFKLLVSIPIQVKEFSFKTFKAIEEEIRNVLNSEEFSMTPPVYRKKSFGVRTFVLVNGELIKFSEVSKYYKAIRDYEKELDRFYVFVDEGLRNEENARKVKEILESYLVRRE